EDKLVYERPDQPKWGVHGAVTDDGRYLVITLDDGTTSRRSRLLVQDLTQPNAKPTPLIDDFESRNFPIDNDGPVFYVRTDLSAPRSRVVAIDSRNPAKANWKEIVPQAADNLTGVSWVGDLLICDYLHDAHTQVKLFKPDGTFVREIPLPGLGTAGGFRGKRTDAETFYSFSSF